MKIAIGVLDYSIWNGNFENEGWGDQGFNRIRIGYCGC